jgi:hypothetical protein
MHSECASVAITSLLPRRCGCGWSLSTLPGNRKATRRTGSAPARIRPSGEVLGTEGDQWEEERRADVEVGHDEDADSRRADSRRGHQVSLYASVADCT